MEICIALTSHRVEFIPLLRDEALASDVIILEEPPNESLFRLLRGEITLESYVRSLDTSFPLYTYFLADLLKNLHSMGKRILQVEPYLEVVQKIQQSIESGSFDELIRDERIEKIRQTEKKAFGAFIDYQEAFMSGDFERLIEATINFSRADAERFVVRDSMRLDAIADTLRDAGNEPDVRVLIEAGSIHTQIPESLDRMLDMDYVRKINLKKKAAEMLGVEAIKNPGTLLTEIFIRNENISGEELRTLAARSLLYISKVTPEEMMPDSNNRFPHFLEEVRVSEEVYSMDYEQCREEFERIWKRRNMWKSS
jgi:hypothetical protein